MKVPRQTISLGDRQSHRLRFIMSVVAAIGCDQLDAELVRTKGALDNWASNVVSAADQLRDSHKRNIFELKSELKHLELYWQLQQASSGSVVQVTLKS